jgi:hypothetical protein
VTLHTSARPASHRPVVSRLRILATLVLGLVTAYLVLERSHAEEIGGGSRVLAEILRGQRPLSPLTWLAFGALGVALLVTRPGRAEVPVRATHR